MTASATLPLRATDWVDSVALPRFDGSLGELRSVELRVEAHLEGTAELENLTGSPASLSTMLAALVTLARPAPGGTVITTAQPSQPRTDNLGAFDGIVDHAGASGSETTLTDDHTSTISLVSPADLTLFTGTGSITLPAAGTDTSTGPTGPDAAVDLSTRVGATVTVTYTYITDTRPPDPPTIVTSPPAHSANPAPVVSFTAEAGASTECRLDAETSTGDWGACTSPWEGDLSGAPDGAYTFLVRATDAASNVGDPASASFTIDRQAPGQPELTTTPPGLGRLVLPTWAFTIDAGAVARCALDGAVDAPCSSPYVADLTSAADGPHEFTVFAVDSAGNASPSVSHTYTLDRRAPAAPSITTEPPSPSADPTPTWTFDLAPEAVMASCSVDGAPFASCASPFTANLAAAADGNHTVAIRNRDLAGNQSPGVGLTYRLDRAAPGAPTIGSPASPSRVVNPTWTIDAEAGATTECRLDDGAWSPCAGSFTTTFDSGSDGVHVLTVRAFDAAGNRGPEATASYTLDTTAPDAPVITTAPADPSDSPTPTWTFTIESGSAASCSVDGGTWNPCASPLVVDLVGATDGQHTLGVRATDAQDNTGPVTTSAFTLDRAGPGAPTITDAPSSPGSAPTVTWTFTAPADTTTTCRIDAGIAQPCDGSITTTFLTDGSHGLAIVARDPAGNRSAAATATYILDRLAPQIPTIIDAPATPARLTTPRWSFTLESHSMGECSLDRMPWVTCTTSFSADLSTADDGPHSFAVRSTDAAGNVGDPATGEFVLDRTPPGLPTIIGGPDPDSDDDTPTWTFAVDNGAVAECRIDDGPWSPCADRVTADLLLAPDGTHSLEVRATDDVGNVGPTAVTAYGLDRVHPAVAVFTSTPLSPGHDSEPEWAFTYEPGTTALCSLDGADGMECDGAFAATLADDGVHDLTVQVVDAAGNTSDPVTSTYALDTTVPSTPTVGAPRTPDRDAQPEWTIAVEPGAVAECSFDGGPAAACGSVFGIDLSGDDGAHRLVVVARDAAGNASAPVQSTYVLDTVTPTAPVLQHTPDRVAWTWRFSIEALTRAECSIDGGPWTACASPLAGGTADRTVRFEVRAVDNAGNRSDITGTTVTPTKSAGIAPPPPPPPVEPGPTVTGPTDVTDPAGSISDGALADPRPVIRNAVPGVQAGLDVDDRSLVRQFRPTEPPFGGAVAQLLQAVGEKTTIPVLLVLIVIGFVAVQNRIDRRDPKLAQAPLRHEPEYMEFE